MLSVPRNLITVLQDTPEWTRNHRWMLIITLAVATMGMTGNFCPANIIDFQSFSWNASDQHIIRNGAPIVEPATDVIPDNGTGTDFFFVQSSFDVFNDVSFSGAGAANPQIYSHAYNYTNPNHFTFYTSQNTTGHSRSYNFSPADIGHPRVRRFTFRDSLTLNGSLILAYNEPIIYYDDYGGYGDYGIDSEDYLIFPNLEDLLATFDVLVTKETVRRNGKIRTNNLLKGSISLSLNEDGSFKLKTRGRIKKRHISNISIIDGLVVVELNDEVLYYSTRARVNQSFSIITTVNSTAINAGSGTGAEVIFGPGGPTIPIFFENGEVPEPASILLLSVGALLGLRRRRNR